jgi:hypothetical protein
VPTTTVIGMDPVRGDDGRPETVEQRADRNWGEILQELRVIQTGTQVFSGFLLAVVFQQRFPRIGAFDLAVYGVLVGLAAVSIVLGLACVALHRTRFRHHDKTAVVTAANRMLRIMIAAVALLTIGVVLLVVDIVFGLAAGIVAGAVAAAVAIVLLLIIPRRWRRVRAS